VRAAATPLGVDPIPPANPYWAEHGLTFEDPDGFRVVLLPEAGTLGAGYSGASCQPPGEELGHEALPRPP
jgi:hypothetical protein